LAETGSKIDDEDARAILLNSLSSNYESIIFTLSQLSFKSLDEMIAALLTEEKRMKAGDIEGNLQTGIALFSKGKKKNRGSIECFYCRRQGDIVLNCKIHAKDLLKGKLKESTNLANTENISDSMSENSAELGSEEEYTPKPLKLFEDLCSLIVWCVL